MSAVWDLWDLVRLKEALTEHSHGVSSLLSSQVKFSKKRMLIQRPQEVGPHVVPHRHSELGKSGPGPPHPNCEAPKSSWRGSVLLFFGTAGRQTELRTAGKGWYRLFLFFF